MDNCYENVFRLFVIHFIYVLKLLTQIAHETRAHSVFFSSQSSKSTELTLGEIASVSKIYVEFLRSFMVPILIFASAQLIWRIGKHPAFKL